MGTSARLADSHTKDRVEPGRLVEEQAALRRVATLVARGAPSTEVFSAVAQEVAQVLHIPKTAVCRYDDDGTVMTVLAVFGDRPDTLHPGSRWPLDGPSMPAEVLRTGRPVRIEDYSGLPGTLAAEAREHGFNRVAGAPIIVDGRVWGVISTLSPDAPLPDDLEDRLAEFTELVAIALDNSQARDELERLAEEQAALRRVATLAAQGAQPIEVFEAVSAEVAQLVQADDAGIMRYEADGTFTALGGWRTSGSAIIGKRFPLEGSMSGLILETRRPSRVEDFEERRGPTAAAASEMGWRSAVGAPVFVEGRLWGALLVCSKSNEPPPADTERRLAEFTEIVAAAIANTENREELADLAEEHAALRRVATLVAAGAPPADVFEAVSMEVAALVGADGSALTRFEADGTVTAVGGWTAGGSYKYVGNRYALEGTVSGVIFETGRPGRVENYADAPGEAPEAAREMGWRSSVGAPITVGGRLWGVLAVISKSEEPLPLDTERRLTQFTELVATAVANADSRAELDASRARIVAAADATRRRIERDLHDGAQQQLVSLALELRAAQASAPPELREHRAELAHVAEELTNVLDGLREIALGIHPAVLAEGGLGPALKTLLRRSQVPVELDVHVGGRLPEPVEVATYYVISEALTNAAKHAQASKVLVEVDLRGPVLRVAVRDDGVGGADPGRGSGLLGLKDRTEAIGGTISVESTPGEGTSLTAELPLDQPAR